MRTRPKKFYIIAAAALLQATLLVMTALANPVQQAQDPDVLEEETLLAGMGYWILKVDNVADASTRHAVTAFQKVEGRKRTGKLSTGDLEVLRFALRPKPRHATGAAHIEIDITRQVLFLTNDRDVVVRILPVSTGTGRGYVEKGKRQVAHTPRGTFRIQRKVNGIRHAPLGTLYYPNYFTGGVAIHGSNSVPAFPASHGCVRIPRFADKAFSALVSVGMQVFVYD